MTFNLPFKSTRSTFSGINVQGSATISQDAYVSGSLNTKIVGQFPIGDGLKLESGTLSSTVAGSGGSTLFAGPGIDIANSTIINTGTLVPGGGISISGGTISSTIPSGISTLVAGQGIQIAGQATIINTGTHAGYVTSFNAISKASNVPIYRAFSSSIVVLGTDANGRLILDPSGSLGGVTTPGTLAMYGLAATVIATLPIGSGLQLVNGTLSSTVTGGTSSTLLAGNGLIESSSTIGMSGTFAGTLAITQGIVSGTSTGTIANGFLDTYGMVNLITGTEAYSAPPYPGINFVFNLGTDSSTITNSIETYTISGTGITQQVNQEVFINKYGTIAIRDYGNTAYHIYTPLTVDKISSLPIGSGLAIASSTLYATGGASTGTVSAYEVLSPSNTLTFGVTTSTASATVVSAIITIYNTASSETAVPVQQMISVPVSVMSNANSTLTNVQFSDNSGSTIIPSWRESGTTNSEAATYWLKLEQGIPASSSIQLQINFFTNNASVLNATDTGLAPYLPLYYGGAYGENDTGTVVFISTITGTSATLYDNFAGTVLSSFWVNNIANATGSLVVDNGIQIGTATAGNNIPAIYTQEKFGVGVYEFYGTLVSNTSGGSYNLYMVGLTSTLSNNSAAMVIANDPSGGKVELVTSTLDGLGTFNSVPFVSTPSIGVWGLASSSDTPSEVYAFYNYSSSVVSTTDLPTLPQNFIMINGRTSNDVIGPLYWVRMRPYQSSGIQSSVQTPTAEESVIVFPKNATFVNPPTSASSNWVGINGTPYLTVSPIGTTNSATVTIKNNGASYGPDTTVNGTLTATYGIQEAINSATVNGHAYLFLLSGTYDVSSAALQSYIAGVTSGAHIVLPYVDITAAPIIPITIVGQNSVWGQSELTGAFSQPAKNGVVIISTITASSVGGNANNYPILGAYYNISGSGEQNKISGIDLTMKEITYTTLSGTGIGGIDLQAVTSLTTDNIVVGVDSSWPLAQPTGTQTGIKLPVSYTNKMHVGNIWIYGYYNGITLGTHSDIQMLWVFANVNAITNAGVQHGSHISFIDAEWNANLFNFVSTDSAPYTQSISVDHIVVSDNQSTITWMDTASYVSGVSGSIPYLHVNTWEQPVSNLSSVDAGYKVHQTVIDKLYPAGYVSATLSSNPPSLGTSYQNTHPYDITIYIPVTYTPTSSAAATLSYGVSTGPSPSVTPFEVEPASATSGRIKTTVLRVPANGYYEFNGVNVTLGTAVIIAEIA